MKTKISRDASTRLRGRELLRPVAEREKDSFIPERDVHERDWQIAEILLQAALNADNLSFGKVERIARLVVCLELLDPERAHKLITNAALTQYASGTTYTIGSPEQQAQYKRLIWSNLKTLGIETARPVNALEFDDQLESILSPLDASNNPPSWEVGMVRDVFAYMQMFPHKKTEILAKLESKQFWPKMLSVLTRMDFGQDWSAHFGLQLAEDLSLLDPAHATEVKTIIKTHWMTIRKVFLGLQKGADAFDLFDPKQVLAPENRRKLIAIHAEEKYEGWFFEMAAALYMLSAETAEVNEQGRIKITRAKRHVDSRTTLPDRLVA